MPIEMPRGLPFSVDTWTANSRRKRHHFLTHSHHDHLQGFAANSFHPIYATHVTKLLTLHLFPRIKEEIFVEIAVGETIVVRDMEGDFSVTALDANHCPGAAMFLFEGTFGNILHTGDCRLSSDCLKKLPLRYMAAEGSKTHLDFVFLDCTFARCPSPFPSKEKATQQVIKCIWNHPNAPIVYLACHLLGQEEILVEMSRIFGAKIFVDKAKFPEFFLSLSLMAPDILSPDSSSRFQVCEAFKRLDDLARAEIVKAREQLRPEPLFIRTSAFWFAQEGQRDLERPIVSESGVWRVCYSGHSSRQELEWALQLLRPNWVISTTPPCLAMDLDYVRKNCTFGDGPNWRLLGRPAGNLDASSESAVVKVDEGGVVGYNVSLKTLYRRMNVPVPRPLPPLKEILDSSKRGRFGF